MKRTRTPTYSCARQFTHPSSPLTTALKQPRPREAFIAQAAITTFSTRTLARPTHSLCPPTPPTPPHRDTLHHPISPALAAPARPNLAAARAPPPLLLCVHAPIYHIRAPSVRRKTHVISRLSSALARHLGR
jgi:hypothetical protein